MAYAFRLDGALALASSLAVVSLALATVRLRPRTHASVSFVAFALGFGGANAAAAMSKLAADPGTAYAWLVILAVFYIPMPLLALHFGWAIGRTSARPAAWAAWAVAALPVPIALLYFAQDPTHLVTVSDEIDPTFRLVRVTTTFEALTILTHVAYAGALVLVFAKARRVTGERRAQLAFVVLGLLVLVSGNLGRDAGYLLADTSRATLVLIAWLVVALRAAIVVACALAARGLDAPFRPWLVLAAIVPAAVGLVEEAGFIVPAGSLSTVGLSRLLVFGCFAYAIARHRMFDLELRLRNLVPTAAYATVALALLGLLWAAGATQVRNTPWLALLFLSGAALAAVPIPRWTRGLLDGRGPAALSVNDYVYERKVRLYRAALEESGANDDPEKATRFLGELRRSLGISLDEHRALLAVARGGETSKNGRYVLLRTLGAGAMGEAWLARDTKLDRQVVLKRLKGMGLGDRTIREQCLAEARAASRIKNPNVVAIYDVLDEAPAPTLVLEYVEGGTLAARLTRKPDIDPSELGSILDGLLQGLAAVHAAGIIHRDVKPENVLLASDGTPKLADLGVALALADGASAQPTLAPGESHPGTLAYMSPEQASGGALDARSDLYAVGAIAFFALAKRHHVDLRALAAAGPPARSSSALDVEAVPAEWQSFVARSLANDRAERFASAQEMRAALPRFPQR